MTCKIHHQYVNPHRQHLNYSTIHIRAYRVLKIQGLSKPLQSLMMSYKAFLHCLKRPSL